MVVSDCEESLVGHRKMRWKTIQLRDDFLHPFLSADLVRLDFQLCRMMLIHSDESRENGSGCRGGRAEEAILYGRIKASFECVVLSLLYNRK